MPLRVLFVCLHGAAKSVIAAEHFRRLARARGLDVEVAAAGVEPDAEIPAPVTAGLRADGLEPPRLPPQGVESADIGGADVVVSFGCALDTRPASHRTIRWDDIPQISDGYAAGRDAIVGRLGNLLDEVAAIAKRAARD